MQWESMGFKDDPFKTQPITASTLELYTGNAKKVENNQFALQTNNIVMVIEGSRGVGTTSFGNFLRFNAQKEGKYFTPTSEKKFRAKAKDLNLWLKSVRNMRLTKDWWKILRAKLRGHYEYYGISENYRAIYKS